MNFFSRVLRDSTTHFVGPSVHRFVRWSLTLYFFLFFFAVFGLTAPAQMIRWRNSSELKIPWRRIRFLLAYCSFVELLVAQKRYPVRLRMRALVSLLLLVFSFFKTPNVFKQCLFIFSLAAALEQWTRRLIFVIFPWIFMTFSRPVFVEISDAQRGFKERELISAKNCLYKCISGCPVYGPQGQRSTRSRTIEGQSRRFCLRTSFRGFLLSFRMSRSHL